jgi:hypothetical protein
MAAMKKYFIRLNLLCAFFLCAVIIALYSCNKPVDTYKAPKPTDATVTTSKISDITAATATCAVKISAIGADFINCGVCWDVSQNPTIQTAAFTTTFNKATNFNIGLTGLSGGLTYYARAFMVTVSRVIYGQQVTFTTVTPPIAVGESYGGGIIFYVDNTGKHGLAASPADLPVNAPWDNGIIAAGKVDGDVVTNLALGTGKANTDYIISKIDSTGTYAALVCRQYKANGFSDWFLPSRDELTLMKQNLYDKQLGNFMAPGYWSSSTYEGGGYYAYMQSLSSPAYTTITMDNVEGIRAARAF